MNGTLPMTLVEQESSSDDRPVVLIVEDDVNMRELIAATLDNASVNVIQAASSQDALDYIESARVNVVLTDLCMPKIDGLEVLKFARQRDNLIQVILITGFGTVESAVDSLKAGAFDYISKPFDNSELLHTVELAVEHNRLAHENRSLRQKSGMANDIEIVGRSASMDEVDTLINAAAEYDCGVLISGESGSGKEMVARKIHNISGRSVGNFVALNCAAVPENIIESELFGYMRGAFTGADRNKPGLLEKANGGTLFLDEINNASLSFQAKLLRVLQDGTYYRIGDTELREMDARVIAASNRNLQELIDKEEFRQDLYYRLKVIEIDIPALRERRSDIPVLAHYFMHKHSSRLGKPVADISTKALGALMRYDWPGNVRELENVIQRMIILSTEENLTEDVLPPEFREGIDSPTRALDCMPPQSLEELEAFFIQKTLREQAGDRAMTAEILRIDKSTLWRKMKRYGITEP